MWVVFDVGVYVNQCKKKKSCELNFLSHLSADKGENRNGAKHSKMSILILFL